MSDVRANAGVPTIAQFGGIQTPSACAPIVVDSTLGTPYTWSTGDVINEIVNGSTLGTNVLTFLKTPSSANLAAALTDETGSGLAVFGNNSTWTPAITFDTPGDLAVSYTRQLGTYTYNGRAYVLTYSIVTSSFTWTTASGSLRITGIPVTPLTLTGFTWDGSCTFGGITKAGYTQMSSRATSNTAFLSVVASGSGVAPTTVTAADMPTGGSVVLRGQVTLEI